MGDNTFDYPFTPAPSVWMLWPYLHKAGTGGDVGENAVRELFSHAAGFGDYLAAVRANSARFQQVYQRLEFVSCDRRNAIFPRGTHILALCEPYCADCVLNLPLIARLAEASPDTDFRVASRDRHEALAGRFPGRGGVSRVPTVMLFDIQWGFHGHWSERGRADHEWMSNFTRVDPLPDITLEDGLPSGEFAAWLDRRFDGQLPVFYAENWRVVRDELTALASVPPLAPGEPVQSAIRVRPTVA